MGIYGLVAVLAACALTLGGAVAAVAAARRDDAAMLRQADRMAYLVFALMTVATGVMVLALVTHDFSVEYVSQVGSRSTPTLYTVISLWGALEGSLLLWGWILALFTALVAWRTPVSVGVPLKGYALGVLLAIGTFFTFLLIGPASPFGTVSPVPLDGPGPEPAAAEPLADGGPSAAAVPRLRGDVGALRLRDGLAARGTHGRGLDPRDSPLDALVVALPERSPSSRGCGGPTRCWAGAATGPGTRSRTPRSCPG
jgi:hypothetical protein